MHLNVQVYINFCTCIVNCCCVVNLYYCSSLSCNEKTNSTPLSKNIQEFGILKAINSLSSLLSLRSVSYSLLFICQNVSHKFKELNMEMPYLCPEKGHNNGGWISNE